VTVRNFEVLCYKFRRVRICPDENFMQNGSVRFILRIYAIVLAGLPTYDAETGCMKECIINGYTTHAYMNQNVLKCF
jgi:hypothetical protein